MTPGQLIKKARLAAGMSQSDLEVGTGIRREYLSNLETGVNANPTIGTLQKIANATGVHIVSLLNEAEDLGGVEAARLQLRLKTVRKQLADTTRKLEEVVTATSSFLEGLGYE